MADFDPPHLYLAPPKGVTPVEFCGDLWQPKTRVPALSCGVVCVILRLAVLVEHRLVTDRRTDGQRDGQTDSHISSNPESLATICTLNFDITVLTEIVKDKKQQ